jgi:predicted HTH transcriptional regulator
MLGISERAVEKQVRNLRESGRLRRLGPDKGGQWEVLENA